MKHIMLEKALEAEIAEKQRELAAIKNGVVLSNNEEIRQLQTKVNWLQDLVLNFIDEIRGIPY